MTYWKVNPTELTFSRDNNGKFTNNEMTQFVTAQLIVRWRLRLNQNIMGGTITKPTEPGDRSGKNGR